jgi:hypothetical protein
MCADKKSFFIYRSFASQDINCIGVELRPDTKPGILCGIPMIPGTNSVILKKGFDSKGNFLNIVTHPKFTISSVEPLHEPSASPLERMRERSHEMNPIFLFFFCKISSHHYI